MKGQSPTPLRVALYTRVSTADQVNANQLAELRSFADKQGWTIAQEFTDVASGALSDRKAFNALMTAAAQRRFDLVLFWSLDRFSREGVSRTLHHLQQLESWGVGFRSFTEPYLDSLGVFKDAILALLATLAKQERIRISERTLAGLQRARKSGKRLGRPALTTDLISRVHLLRGKGFSFPVIAKRLNIAVGSAHQLGKDIKKKKITTLTLWLRVEGNNKFIRGVKRVRQTIEQLYLEPLEMKHLRGWEYELTVSYEDDADLDNQVSDLLSEIHSHADLHYCFVETDVREKGTERSW